MSASQHKHVKSFDGTKIHYVIKKQEGPVLIFVHGISGNYTGCNRQLSYFQAKGYSTIALDLRGHGKSQFPCKSDFRLESMAKDIDAIIRYEKIEKVTLIGHCFGAVICLVFYKLFPQKCKALVIINSTYKNPLASSPVKSAKYFAPFFKAFYDFNIYIFKNVKKHKNRHINFVRFRKWPNTVLMGASTLIFTDLATIAGCHREFLNFDGLTIVKNINIKTLIIAGKDDHFFSEKVSEKMGRIIKNSEFHVINKGRHLTVLKAAKEVNECVYDFISKT